MVFPLKGREAGYASYCMFFVVDSGHLSDRPLCESPILSDYGTVSEHVSQESVVVMNIGSYTFQEFKRLAENFHGYAAPGLLIGGYMVEMAKARIPEGTLFEAVVETRKCLPDAVQLLTLCSAGNNWMKVHNLGRYAVSLFDKHTGERACVSVDPAKLDAFLEIRAGSQGKAQKDQDEVRLLSEIEEAGDGICVKGRSL